MRPPLLETRVGVREESETAGLAALGMEGPPMGEPARLGFARSSSRRDTSTREIDTMFNLSWLRERGVTRGRPAARRRVRTLALGAMIVGGLFQTGCQSGPCGSRVFGPCGFAARATSRVVEPFRRVAARVTGGPEYVSGAPIEYAEPMGVVVPAAPFGTTPPVVEGSSIPSTVAPTNPDAPTNLEPLPRAEPGPSPSNRSSGVRQPSSYDAQRPAANPARGENLAHTLISTPDPAVKPVRETAKPSNRAAAAGDLDTVLDDLPPLDLPPEVTARSDSPPIAPAAEKPEPKKAEAAAPAPDAIPTSAPAPADDHASGRLGREAEPTPAAEAEPPPAPAIEPASNEALGISRFVVVDLELAGGGAPSPIGLGWLAGKGYKTLLDLRDPSEIDLAFLGEAARRGLRYVSFPTDLEKLDREHIDRFAAELALNAARPLYFFDDDGNRAGAMWFTRRVLIDKVGWEIAHREATELGLTNNETWQTVREAVERQLALSAPIPAGRVDANANANANTPAPPPAPKPEAPKPTALLESVQGGVPALVEMIRNSSSGLPDAWRPAAAILLTSLSFPLAFLGRSMIPVIVAKSRASLPGPGPQPRSLPPASDA